MTIRKRFSGFEIIFLYSLLFICLIFTFYQNINLSREFHFSLLASSFLQGRTDIQEAPEKFVDTSLEKDGRFYFWHEPLPGVLMMPFAAIFGSRAPQGYLNIIIIIIELILVNKLLLLYPQTKKLNIRLWFILVFFFASSMVSVIWSPKSWYLTQNLGIALVLMTIWEWKENKNKFLVFLPIILLTLTRRTMLFPICTYLLISAIFSNEIITKKIIRLVPAVFGAIIGIILISLYYNFALHRNVFVDIKKQNFQTIYTGDEQLEKISKTGTWNLINIPTNLAKYTVLGPQLIKEKENGVSNLKWPFLNPSDDGISFFILSPIFLSLFFLPIPRKKEILGALGAVFAWAMTILPFYASGSTQFGARYTAELVPFLFLLLIEVLPQYFYLRAKLIVIFSILFNIFLLIAKVSLGGFILM